MNTTRKSYPSDVSDADWAFLAPYLTLMREDAPQRDHPIRELYNGLCYVVKTGCQWRFVPHDLPPWTAVYQQARRWNDAGVFEAASHDLRVILRLVLERDPQPAAGQFPPRQLFEDAVLNGDEGIVGANLLVKIFCLAGRCGWVLDQPGIGRRLRNWQ